MIERYERENLLKFSRQLSSDDLIQPLPPTSNISYSVMTVAGVDWVCQEISETQCKPLYPKVRRYSLYFVMS